MPTPSREGLIAPVIMCGGSGTRLWPAVRAYALPRWQPDALRAAVAAFNERSTRLCLSAGFVVIREFEGPGGRPFRELLRLPA